MRHIYWILSIAGWIAAGVFFVFLGGVMLYRYVSGRGKVGDTSEVREPRV